MTLLEVSDLSLSFGGVRAIHEVSFDVAEGEIFSIIGPNGAGKTSIFNAISRFYDVDAGCIKYRAQDITHIKPHKVAGLGIARTFQNSELFEHESVLQNLSIARDVHGTTNLLADLLFLPSVRRYQLESRELIEQVIDLLDLQAYRYQPIANLPFGVRKMVEIARGLCLEPTLLLLDEPSSGLNPEETEDLVFWIEDINEDLGITILMVEHDMSLVGQVSHRVMAMNEGEVLAIGTYGDVRRNEHVLDAYLGTGNNHAHLGTGYDHE